MSVRRSAAFRRALVIALALCAPLAAAVAATSYRYRTTAAEGREREAARAQAGQTTRTTQAGPCGMPEDAARALGELGAIVADTPLTDFGHRHLTAHCYFAASPEHPEAVGRLVRVARQHGVSVRIRGRAHSTNGSTLPSARELVLLTNRLNGVAFAAPGSVDAGGGVTLRRLDIELRRFGYRLPVLNDGPAGPTVGGYLSASGMGSDSQEHGGFWQHVLSVRVADGRGDVRDIERSHPDFLWLFGAMGQLGVIVQARLAVLRLSDADYPLGTRLRVEDRPADVGGVLRQGHDANERLHWFTLLVKPDRRDEARKQLRSLLERHAATLAFRALYEYRFNSLGPIPPLFFDLGPPVMAVGVWGAALPGASTSQLDALERDFAQLARDQGYRRYIQSETPRGPKAYEDYFGASLYARFRDLKHRYDPDHLINRGSVFSLSPELDPAKR